MNIESAKIKSALSSLKWLLAKQNKDGSWGNSSIEKIRWTSNALLTMHELGFNSDYTPITKSVKWLNAYSQNEEEWYLKIPPLLALGFQNELEKNGEIENLKRIIADDKIGVLPFKVAIILELKKHKINIEGLDKVEFSVLNTLRDEGNSLLSFSNSTNTTSLYCEFLSTFYIDKHKDTIAKCISWVLVRKIVSSQNHSICWENSYGKTSYVLINLLNTVQDQHSIIPLIKPILYYFQQDKEGAILPDKIAAYKSTSSVYTTILFIRLVAAIANSNTTIYKDIFGENFKEVSLFEIRNRKIMSILKLTLISVIIFLSIGCIIYFVIGRAFAESVFASLIAAAMPLVFTIIKKYLNNNVGF
ncbi:MAG: hypothetical protein Q8M15_04770 [Bacteroidota bacterium]|nr:hypothetical protein [Bacteroidota bacterium]